MIGLSQDNYLIIYGASKEFVRINMKDGTLTYGPDYTPDNAAHAFWLAVSSQYREFLEWKKQREAHGEQTKEPVSAPPNTHGP